MAEKIPNLWRDDEDASRLYKIFLACLAKNEMPERVIVACRQIRRLAARGPGPKEAMFTFSTEIDALCELKQYKSAWRVLHAREEVLYGERVDIANNPERTISPPELEYEYAPLLFFLKRFQKGCFLKEAYLDYWFRGSMASTKVRSYDILFSVCNGDIEPSNRCRVTLSHFYSRLGKGLTEWRHWEAFVNGFHPKLFRQSGVAHDELIRDASRLPIFFENLLAIRDKRVTSGVGGSVSDLIDSPGRVKKRQDAIRKKLGKFDQRTKSRRSEIDTKLQRLFPELRDLR